MTFDLKDYVDVAERIAEFRVKHPEGSLQSEVLRWPDEGFPFVAVQATAFRDPSDPAPGKGLAWENFPGRTPYTKDSELQNAETSAWGRAIVAVLAADTKRGVASRQEVSRASGGSPSSASSPEKRSSQREAPPEPTSVGGAAQTRETVSSPEVPGGTSAPTDTYVPPSGPVQGEGAANPPGGTTGEGGQAPSPTTDDSLPATAEDWAVAKRNGLTATKAKAIAKGLGFTPDNVLDLTRREVAAVINRYLEVKK